jgi:hypothetical protein
MDDDQNILPFQLNNLHSRTEIRTTKSRVLHFNAGLLPEYVDALWRDPAKMFAEGKLLRSTPMRAASLLRLDGSPYIIKHYFGCSWRDSIGQAVQGAESFRTYNLGCVLADAGVRTPRPVACLENRVRGKRSDSYLLYPFVEGRMLRSSVNQELLSADQISRVRRQLADMWRQLSQLKVGLKDANAGNFIVTRNGVVWIIDLDGSRIHRNPVAAYVRLHLSWMQVNRSMRRAMRERGRPCAEVRRAA